MMPIRAIDNERMRINFSSHAEEYDRYASVQRRVVELLCDRCKGFAAEPGRLLDVGTGTGSLAAALSCYGSDYQLVVMDIAHGMTKTAAERLPAVSACDGDARQLPFAAATFTGIFSSSVYQWVDRLPEAFAEIARVLKPGGVFALALFGDQTLFELRNSHRQAVFETRRRSSSHVQSFPSIDEVAAALAAAGLCCRDLFSKMEVEYHADVPELLRQLKQIGASNAASDRPRGLASRKIMSAMIKSYDVRYRCSAGLPASYEVIIAIAEKKAGDRAC
ncbi:MAG: methyltransferase domain-containing protein [Desulfuromonadales bacterium]